MGEVYAGFDERLDRPVALKRIWAEVIPVTTSAAEAAGCFALEAELLMRPNLPYKPPVRR